MKIYDKGAFIIRIGISIAASMALVLPFTLCKYVIGSGLAVNKFEGIVFVILMEVLLPTFVGIIFLGIRKLIRGNMVVKWLRWITSEDKADEFIKNI
jgi:hypothetical protein